MSSTRTGATKIATVIIPVNDQDAMVSFYEDTLGLEKRVDIPFGGHYRWVEVGVPGAETTIALAPPPEGRPSGGRETGISLHSDDVDGYHQQLKAGGADVDDEVTRMGGPVPPMFWLRDPENNSLMVVGNS